LPRNAQWAEREPRVVLMSDRTTGDVEIAVIGRGLIGSAAARHLAETNRSVALIGPGEPADRTTSNGPFCSHPDEGRITRIAGRSEMWTTVAAQSIERYADIARRSGIEFHTPRGVLIGYPNGPEWQARAEVWGSDARIVERDWVREHTGIAISNGHPLLYEGAPAGYINPRRLVAAQTELARQANAFVVEAAVNRIERNSSGLFRLETSNGAVVARQLLVATGAFGSPLFEWKLKVERRARTTVMARLDDDQRIPSLLLDSPPDDRINEAYWVPPVRYPDGSVRIKIGGDLKATVLLDDADLVPWFRSDGDPVEIECLTNNLYALLPDAPLGDVVTAPCVITGTPSEMPYIGWVDDGVAVALGGNGSAAKSSDELGRIAASLFGESGWDSILSPGLFTPQLL